MCKNNLFNNINGFPLDEQQIAAATCEEKHSVIVAGAGSGKSTTMIGKIKFLIEEKKIKPEEILCISFTNEATNNLKKNILKNCRVDIDTKTFHKLALKILQDNKIDFSLVSANYLKFVVNEFFLSKDDFFVISNAINFLKNRYHLKNWNEYKKLIRSKKFDDFKNFIVKFLNLYFSKYSSINMLENFLKKSNNAKQQAFLKLTLAIYHTYESEKKSQNMIDYDDLIILATKIVNNNGIVQNYKYIIIDEFQDTSPIRFDLIKAITKKNNASLTVVGDDFQSIYRFSGCNLELFLNFSNNFKNTKVLKIENTYRNSQELIDIAGRFIMKNPAQIRKNLKSNKHYSKPIKIIYEKHNSLKRILITLNNTSFKNILILGRNNFDIQKYLDKDLSINEDGHINYDKCNNLSIRFLTVHKSKGLEADIVIILNLINSDFGFPNKLENDELLNIVCEADNFVFEEERRLFYVALTRTKNQVYLFTQKNNSSIFIKELLRDYKNQVEIIKKY